MNIAGVNVPLSLMLGCESSIEGDSYPEYVRKWSKLVPGMRIQGKLGG